MIHEMTYTMNYACGDPEKIEQMAKLGRLMKADPGLVLAFIENAKEPEPAKVVELPAAKENTESEDEDE